jgi:hypothetical protein
LAAYNRCVDAVVALRAGITRSTVELRNPYSEVKVSGCTPIAGLEMAKALRNGWHLCCVLDYAFGQKKTRDMRGSDFAVNFSTPYPAVGVNPAGVGVQGFDDIDSTVKQQSKVSCESRGVYARLILVRRVRT